MRVVPVAAVLVVAAFAGCIFGPGCDGEGPVRVIEGPDGAPIEGATLSATFGGTRRSTTTDADGRANAPDGDFSVTKPGYLPEMACYREGRHSLTVSLYRSHIEVTMEGTLVGGDVGTNQAPDVVPDRWDAKEVPFGATVAMRQAYAARLHGLNATLAWNNTLLNGAGDLALGLGPTTEQALFWHDSDGPQVQPGAHREVLRVTIADFDERWRGADTLYAGAGAGKAYASAGGIAYRLDLEAFFGERHGSPGPLPLAVLVAVGFAAVLLRRRE